MKGRIFNIQRYSIHDGPGIRTTVFLKGCPLRCLWCQNPEGISPKNELFFNKERCTGCGRCVETCEKKAITITDSVARTDRKLCIGCGKCVEVCPNEARQIVGKEVSVEEVVEVVKKDRIFYERSGGGVTLSGGEPLMQPIFVQKLLERCKLDGIHTTLDTSGFASWDTLKEVLKYTDLILYDFKCMDPEKHRVFTGVSNELILENVRRITSEFSTPIWARIPIIPGYNDDIENIRATASFLTKVLKDRVERVNLLPYHRLGEVKYERLERENTSTISEPPEEQILEIKAIFESFGLQAYVGG